MQLYLVYWDYGHDGEEVLGIATSLEIAGAFIVTAMQEHRAGNESPPSVGIRQYTLDVLLPEAECNGVFHVERHSGRYQPAGLEVWYENQPILRGQDSILPRCLAEVLHLYPEKVWRERPIYGKEDFES
jgi:hypothetical protein